MKGGIIPEGPAFTQAAMDEIFFEGENLQNTQHAHMSYWCVLDAREARSHGFTRAALDRNLS